MPSLSLPQFLETLKKHQSPSLIWYSAPGERVELSGRVFDNWVSKTANFLVEELDVEVDDAVVLPRQLHWRTLAIAVASMRVGAVIREQAEDARASFAFTPQDIEDADAEYAVLVEQSALGMRFMGKVPDSLDAVDYAFEVRSFADVYMGFNQPDAITPAFESVSHGELLQNAHDLAQKLTQTLPTEIHAVQVSGDLTRPSTLTQFLAAQIAGLAVVVLDPEIDFTSDNRLEKIFADEKAQPFPSL